MHQTLAVLFLEELDLNYTFVPSNTGMHKKAVFGCLSRFAQLKQCKSVRSCENGTVLQYT